MSHTKITSDEVRRIATLARLRFDDEKIEAFAEDFDRLVSYVEKLEEVDVEGVEPMTRLVDEIRAPRPDVPSEGLTQQEALKNAPEKTEGFFRVPRVVEGG